MTNFEKFCKHLNVDQLISDDIYFQRVYVFQLSGAFSSQKWWVCGYLWLVLCPWDPVCFHVRYSHIFSTSTRIRRNRSENTSWSTSTELLYWAPCTFTYALCLVCEAFRLCMLIATLHSHLVDGLSCDSQSAFSMCCRCSYLSMSYIAMLVHTSLLTSHNLDHDTPINTSSFLWTRYAISLARILSTHSFGLF